MNQNYVGSSNQAQGGILNTTLCDKVCQWLATGRWLSPVSSTNKTDLHDWNNGNIVESDVKHHNPNVESKLTRYQDYC